MVANISNRKTNGYVSKESLRFFIPLYKFCRRLGLERKDINFGVKGSREFFIKDTSLLYNGGKFYDFTIKSISLIIEYHGTFWHARRPEEWRNPFIDFNESYVNDVYKKQLAEQRGMRYIVVWSDDNKKEATNMLKVIISEFVELKNVKS